MLARINDRKRVTLVCEESDWLLEDVQRDWALKILTENKGYSRPHALAVVHTGVSDSEWLPAYRKAKDKKRNAVSK